MSVLRVGCGYPGMTDQQQAFKEFMDGLLKRYGTANKLAAALGLTATSLLRAAHDQFTLNVENCLRLAAVSGELPSRILRLAGKADIADLLESLYGQQSLTPREKQLLSRWSRLSPRTQANITVVIDDFLAQQDDKRHTA